MSTELAKSHVLKARQAIAMLPELERKLQHAMALGLDCEEQREKCEWAKNFLLKFNELFSPEFSVPLK